MTEVLKKFIKDYNIFLDEAQSRAAYKREGKQLLLAVPGSGKTTVMIARLGYLTKVKEVLPEEILAMTYSVAAANEMKQRYIKTFGDDGIQIRTIHSFCNSVLSTYCELKKRTAFKLISEEDGVKSTVRKIMVANGGYPSDVEVSDAVTKIAYCVNMMMTDSEIREKITLQDRDFFSIFDAYRSYKKENMLMDYDDMLFYAYTALTRYKDVFKEATHRFRYICVDEAQDTSKLQHEIIKLIVENGKGLFMVGDEDQSIYGFRAAFPEALTNFDKTYPDAEVLFLENNYRSSKNIVYVSDTFISRNKERKPKKMVSTHGEGDKIEFVTIDDLFEAPSYFAERICSEKNGTVAFLARQNDSLLPLIDEFSKNGISFTLRGKDSLFFTHYTVNDIKAFFHLGENPYDKDAFMSIYYKLSCGLSKAEAEGAVTNGHGPILSRLIYSRYINLNKKDKLKRVAAAFEKLPKLDAYDSITLILDKCGYNNYMSDHPSDMTKIYALQSIASNHRKKADFLKRLNELEDIVKNGKKGGNITLSTVHSAKGMEFDTVYVIDAINDIFPTVYGSKIITADAATQKLYEEERRLFYVAMTRAKQKLALVKYKYIFGGLNEGQSFVREIENIIDEKGLAELKRQIGEINVGTRLIHNTLGRGIVTKTDFRGNEKLATVTFEDGVTKTLSLRVCAERKLIKLDTQ